VARYGSASRRAPRAREGWWRSHSVRVRLTMWYVAAMIVVLGVYVFAVYAFVNRSVSESLDEQLRREFYWIEASLYQTPDGEFMLNEPEQLVPEEGLPWVQVWSGDGSRLLFRNSEAQRRPVPESQSIVSEGSVSIPTDTVPMRILTRIVFLLRDGAVSDERIVIQVGRSEAAAQESLRELALILLLGLPVAVAAAGLGGYALAKRALAPIERMTERARTITAQRLSARLPVDNPGDEMGRLAAVFNETLGRLEASFEQMRRFTADVSHELRTPLTSIRSVGEVGLQSHRDEAAYRSIIGSMLEEADRLASLVDRLLTLSRAETRQDALVTEPVDLAALAEEVVAHLSVLAEEKSQSIAVERQEAPDALADRFGLRQALINLVDNAIKFTPPGGRIRIRVSGTPAGAVLDVIDSGPGVAPEACARIFDRFYRGDGVDAAGTGLGLSIAKYAVEASGGHLTLEDTGPHGSTFRMALPRAPHATAAPVMGRSA
jgi:heavy metal sensor kinase